MSTFFVEVTVGGLLADVATSQPIRAMVDSGSPFTWFPGEVLGAIGVQPRKSMLFRTATGSVAERQLGYAIVGALGLETNDQVVFAQPGDPVLLGARTLTGFGVAVDYAGHRFVPREIFAAGRPV